MVALENILFYQYYATLTKGNTSKFMQNYLPFTKALNRAKTSIPTSNYKRILFIICKSYINQKINSMGHKAEQHATTSILQC